MFDIDALIAAGFEKLPDDEWEAVQKQLPQTYGRTAPATPEKELTGRVTIDYVLKRGSVSIVTEQNSQEQSPYGIPMTVHYPEIVVIGTEDGRRVACNAADTELILALADEFSQPLEDPRQRTRDVGPDRPTP